MAADELDKLLGEPAESAKRRAREAYDSVAGARGDSVVIYGAGGLGRKVLAGLRKLGVEPVAFADNNPQLWGRSVEGLPVLSPEDSARSRGDTATFVIAIMRVGGGHVEARRRLIELGCQRVVPFTYLAWKHPQIFLPYYSVDLPQKVLEDADPVREAFGLLADEASRSEFLAQLRFRLWADFEALNPPLPGEQYFPDRLFKWDNEEVFVDSGAFDGDTIRVILDRYGDGFRRIEAFEPDPINFQKLRRFVDSLEPSVADRIALRAVATGAERCTVRFSASGSLTSAVGSAGETTVDCMPLDELLEGIRPTFIKMDIEGSEPDSLLGARETIGRDAPLLAVCAYHVQDHLWKIPTIIRSFSDQYSFHLLPHNDEGFDLVYYAVPESRQS
jgi:FkbM family methyltransferase